MIGGAVVLGDGQVGRECGEVGAHGLNLVGMAGYVAFLRGMNLGGRRITNDDLRAACEACGLTDVATFRASGNVIFEAPAGVGGEDLSTKIEAGLAEELGYEVPVFLRSCAQVADDRRPQAVHRRPAEGLDGEAAGRDAARRTGQGGDEGRAGDGRRRTTGSRSRAPSSTGCRSGGMSDSDLDLKTLEARLGPWTMRTMGTIEQIAAKHCA